jgi:L-rhamnose mutarotase
VLFSDNKVSSYINENFEPAWQSVRAVPTINIDFGNGEKVTRTLHGNIVTYVCSPSGIVIDSLPGLYQPAVYVEQLERFHKVASKMGDPIDKDGFTNYHLHAKVAKPLSMVAARSKASTDMPDLKSPEEVANWKQLIEETIYGETVRRKQVHAMLANHGLVRPDELTKEMYREVLHCDLDDPYLGLGQALFANYPFKDDDSTRQ